MESADYLGGDTFTVLARCSRTGKLGVASATRSLAVGWRVPHIVPNVGAVAVMACADPRIGAAAGVLLRDGLSADSVLESIIANDDYREFRQLAVLANDGTSAVWTGGKTREWGGDIRGDGFVVLGNVLPGPVVLEAMAQVYEESDELSFEGRLVDAVAAGHAAGGQIGGARSAALLVYADQPFPYVDLRVDEHTEPVAELRRVLEIYTPLIDYYQSRMQDPALPPQYST